MNIWITILLAANPDIIRDSDDKWDNEIISAVERLDCAEAVFKIISSCRIKKDSIKFKPEVRMSPRMLHTKSSKIASRAN